MSQVSLASLRLGALLAEGGEGRVFEVVGEAGRGSGRFVYKELRQPRPLMSLAPLVAFPSALAVAERELACRVVSSSAWPTALVVGDGPAYEGSATVALGTVMPRAPEGFWLRHRDGTARPASLSYLAGDPDRIAVAYGIQVPGPGTAGRVGVVYALARLLEAWQAEKGPAHVIHGDLSARNVLWSLAPTPAVYVLDCDGATLSSGAGLTPTDGAAADSHLRATTPNWDDPTLPPGRTPTEGSDRYALALAFLRVVGAAHFPLQARQRTNEHVDVDLELPRTWRKLPGTAPLWRLCERSLSLVNDGDRPRPSEWAGELEVLLDRLGSSELAAAVRTAQGDPRSHHSAAAAGAPSGSVPGAARRGGPLAAGGPVGGESAAGRDAAPAAGADTGPPPAPDVTLWPVLRHRAPSTWQLISAALVGAGCWWRRARRGGPSRRPDGPAGRPEATSGLGPCSRPGGEPAAFTRTEGPRLAPLGRRVDGRHRRGVRGTFLGGDGRQPLDRALSPSRPMGHAFARALG